MHLWPSMRLRDSFKNAYLKKLELNLHRMNTQKRGQNENQQKLLEENDKSETNCLKCEGIVLLFRELLMILSCCYCCFCCGACIEDEESS